MYCSSECSFIVPRKQFVFFFRNYVSLFAKALLDIEQFHFPGTCLQQFTVKILFYFCNCFLQMTKTIKKLEKEKLSWKTKFENGNRSLVQMVDEVGHALSDFHHAVHCIQVTLLWIFLSRYIYSHANRGLEIDRYFLILVGNH